MGVEEVLNVLVARSLESLGKSAFKEVASWYGARNDLKKLEDTIRAVQARIHDAERRQEDKNSDVIKVWLGRLRLVLYRVDDLFDKVLTLDRQKQLTKKGMLSKVGISSSNRKMANEIKAIREELDVIKSDMDGLNLRVLVAKERQLPLELIIKKRESASFVKKEDVIGRENDIEMIIEMLFDPKYDEERLTVIPIVGFGGIGKTTLAQYVFNDESVQEHFDLLAWVCIPEVDNPKAIMKKIYRSLNVEDFGDYSLDQIKSGIQNSIKDQKYIFVLDDIWDESRNIWLDLIRLLECGGLGSKIIATTRSDVVAKVVGTIPKAYKLGILTDDESWNLFKRLAFKSGQDESNPNLIQIGKEIVNSCGNVPLAIRVVGSLLYSEDSEKEWNLFKEDQLSRAKLITDGNIMPVLKLSYDYLTPALKQCFAYCSLFPKDYVFSKVALVHLWMSQGYFEPSNKDTGDHYFMELLWRNFFQDPEDDEEGNVKTCKMHDLLHDLAQHIASDESKLFSESSMENCDGLIHASVNFPGSDANEGWEPPKSLLLARRMRSLLFVSSYENSNSAIKASSLERVISKFKYLRALDLKNMIDVVPNSIKKLRHLRYLNLEGNTIKYLPSTMTSLENLQTLNLDSCEYLKELPTDFPKLANLRHLDIDWGNLTDLPSGFGNMTSLHELHTFVVGEGKHTGIDSLPALNLRRKLEIHFCKWHRNAVQEAQMASLKDNQDLTNLILNFRLDNVEDDTPTFGELDEMLRCLQLPQNLQHLKVDGYRGIEMPSKWFAGFSNLVSICFEKCNNSKILPRFSQLPCLKSLYLRELDALEYIEDENDNFGAAHNNYFPYLIHLELVNMPQLKGWIRPRDDDNERRQLFFPRLSLMKLDGCRQLMSMPQTPQLEQLEVKRTNWELLKLKVMTFEDEDALSSSSSSLCTSLKQLKVYQLREEIDKLSISNRLFSLDTIEISFCNGLKNLMFESSNSIRHLAIYRCKSLRNISKGMQHLCALEELKIRSCESLEEEDDDNEGNINNSWQNLKRLRSLQLSELPKIKRLPPGITSLTTLERLSLSNLRDLTQLPEDINNLSLLHDLWITNCPNLKSLPPSLLHLTSLQNLQIKRCPDLEEQWKALNEEQMGCHQPDDSSRNPPTSRRGFVGELPHFPASILACTCSSLLLGVLVVLVVLLLLYKFGVQLCLFF